MTRIQAVGIKIILFFLFLTLLACKTIDQNVLARNYFNKDYFYNDSLKVSIDFGKGFQFENLANCTTKILNQDKRKIEELKDAKLLLSGSSENNNYKIKIFYQKGTKSADQARIIFNDTIKNETVFLKQKQNTKLFVQVKPLNDSNIPAALIAKELIGKINFDSLDQNKLSYTSIFSTYTNPLQAINKLESAPLPENNMKFQMLATSYSFISNNGTYDSLISSFEDERRKKFNPIITKILDNQLVLKDSDVFTGISEMAKNNKIIILNENHYYPKHRLFAMKLMDVLKQNGFKYLSLEGFYSSKKSNYIPNTDNGVYIVEPYFGHFIRKAKAMGFTIVGHESDDYTVDREIGQAKKIMEILEKNPNEKIFVYVGLSHLEKNELNKKRWMASYLKEYSKEEPLTINQVKVVSNLQNKLLLIPRKLLPIEDQDKSSADYFLDNNLKADLRKVYPNLEFRNYILKNKIFKDFKNKRLLISLFDSNEYEKLKELTIAQINLIQKSDGGKIQFCMPAGNYRLIVKTEDDRTIFNDSIIIK